MVMHDRPTAAELVDAVTEFLERDLQPSIEGRLAFHTRVAVNALRIVRREMELGPELDAVRRSGLHELLGDKGAGATGVTSSERGEAHADATMDPAVAGATTRELEVDLARRVRDGSLDARRPELVAYLRATLRLQLDIVHPGYVRDTGTVGEEPYDQ
jgi:Domain of unknown function (DUF6285)